LAPPRLIFAPPSDKTATEDEVFGAVTGRAV
jgi:hypothetical protein